jgi:hypothetical protein
MGYHAKTSTSKIDLAMVASHLAQVVAKGVFLSATWVTACLVLGQVVVSVLVLFLLFFCCVLLDISWVESVFKMTVLT